MPSSTRSVPPTSRPAPGRRPRSSATFTENLDPAKRALRLVDRGRHVVAQGGRSDPATSASGWTLIAVAELAARRRTRSGGRRFRRGQRARHMGRRRSRWPRRPEVRAGSVGSGELPAWPPSRHPPAPAPPARPTPAPSPSPAPRRPDHDASTSDALIPVIGALASCSPASGTVAPPEPLHAGRLTFRRAASPSPSSSSLPAAGGRRLLAGAGAVLAHSLSQHLSEPAPADRLPRRGRDRRGAVVRVRPRRATSAPSHRSSARAGVPPAWHPLSACGRRARSAGCGSSPRGSSAARARPTSRRSSCGSTAGSASPSCPPSSGRSGTGSTRSRRSTTSGPASLRRLGVGGWATAEYPGGARSVAGGRRRSSSSSGSSSWQRRRAARRCSSCSSATPRSPSR